MDNHNLTPITRAAAAKNFYSILKKLQDKPLMALRTRLIQATQAGNRQAVLQITQQMRDYAYEDHETGQDTK